MTEFTYNYSFLVSAHLLSLSSILFNYVIRVIATYYLHYKVKFVGNLT